MVEVTLHFPDIKHLDAEGLQTLTDLIRTILNEDLPFEDGKGNDHNACCPDVTARNRRGKRQFEEV